MNLTPEESHKVELNHNLIYKCLKVNKIDIDTYYGSAAIGLCIHLMKARKRHFQAMHLL